jgi:hypothetical protein
MNLEPIGGHMFMAEEEGADGHNRVIVAVEIESGKLPFVADMGRPLTRTEIEELIQFVYNETVKNER